MMNQPTDFEKQRSDIRLATERFIRRRPFLDPILRPYAALCIEKINRVEALEASQKDHRPPLDPRRLERGLPAVDGKQVTALKNLLDTCFGPIHGVLQQQFSPLGESLKRLGDLDREADLGRLAAALLSGDGLPLETLASRRGADLGVLHLLLQWTLGPVLAWIGAGADIDRNNFGAHQGTCPVCGFLPAVSSLSTAGDLGSEFLRGGGGQHWLHCALCGFAWRTARGSCPACGNRDHDRHRVYPAEGGNDGERLDICLACNGYLPGIDLRESPSPMPPLIAAVGMIHLDAWASENGYHPLVQTPWNRLQ
jgi:FdhE protein